MPSVISGRYAISGSIPQETASWTIALELSQSGSTLSGSATRVVEGYDPEMGSTSEVTDRASVSGSLSGDVVTLHFTAIVTGAATFRVVSSGLEPIVVDAYHGGISSVWRRG